MISKAMSFNEDAQLYDKLRPHYPDQIFTTLKQEANLNADSSVLEVGCGTGQATRSLTRFTQHITCVEPGESLLAVAKQKFPNLTFVNCKFEDFKSDSKYDMILSATAWHWVDPKMGYTKAYELLKDGGHLAILHNYHIETDPEAFHNKAQFIYRQYSNRSPDLGSRGPIDETRKSLENQYFHLQQTKECQWEHTYTIDEYLALRNTYSDHRTMQQADRIKFEQQLRDFAEKEFDGKITKHYTTVIFIAKKK